MSPIDWIQALSPLISSWATAIGVGIAVRQLAATKRQAQVQFEDSLTAQYRQLMEQLPLAALLGRELEATQMTEALRVFYLYFDLSNEQALLHKQRRVSNKTWATWREGISQNLNRPAFRQAWQQLVPDLDGSFDDLKDTFRNYLSGAQ